MLEKKIRLDFKFESLEALQAFSAKLNDLLLPPAEGKQGLRISISVGYAGFCHRSYLLNSLAQFARNHNTGGGIWGLDSYEIDTQEGFFSEILDKSIVILNV